MIYHFSKKLAAVYFIFSFEKKKNSWKHSSWICWTGRPGENVAAHLLLLLSLCCARLNIDFGCRES